MTPAPRSSHDQNPENQLGRTLARKADQLAAHGSVIDLDSVLDRAGEIRRGRRMRATIAMAAVVLAIAVPVGINVLNDPTAPKKPPVAEKVETKPDNSDVTLGNSQVKMGKPPKIAYSNGADLITPEATVAVPGGNDVNGVAEFDGATLVSTNNPENGEGLVSVIGDNATNRTWPSAASKFVVSPERNVAAFVDADGTVVAVQDGGERYYELGTLPKDESWQADAVTGENCSGRSADADCTIYVSSRAQDPQVMELTPGSDPRVAFRGFQRLSDLSVGGLAAGMTSTSDTGSCSEVRSSQTAVLWRTCDYSLETFSPDGKYLLAGSTYGDGGGDKHFTILDARTGDPVLELASADNAFVQDVAWEDDTHVIGVVYDKVGDAGSSALLRFEVNGHREYASGKVKDGTGADALGISRFVLG